MLGMEPGPVWGQMWSHRRHRLARRVELHCVADEAQRLIWGMQRWCRLRRLCRAREEERARPRAELARTAELCWRITSFHRHRPLAEGQMLRDRAWGAKALGWALRRMWGMELLRRRMAEVGASRERLSRPSRDQRLECRAREAADLWRCRPPVETRRESVARAEGTGSATARVLEVR